MTVVACYHSYCVDLSQLLKLITFSYPPLPSDRQHASYDDCLEVKREYYQNSSVLTQCSQSAAHLWAILTNWLGLSHWDPYAVHKGGCLELYYYNMVEWFWWDSSLISTINWSRKCFNTVGLVIWPVKIVPEMTYYVSSGTLSRTHSLSILVIITLENLDGFW